MAGRWNRRSNPASLECGSLCSHWPSFVDHSSDTFESKLTAVWEMPNDAGRIQSHTHARTHATVKITHFSSCHSASAHSLMHLALQSMKHTQIQWMRMRMSVHTCEHAKPAPWPELRLRMRRHMRALTGDTEQTWLLSIKPVNLIIRLAGFSGKILLTVSLSACFYNLHGNIYMCSLSHFIPFSSVLAWLHPYFFFLIFLLFAIWSSSFCSS